MLAAWWDRNMHGRRLVGNVAGASGYVLLVLVLAANPGVLPESSPLDLILFSVGFAAVAIVRNARKERIRGLARTVALVAVWAVSLWIVIHADDWLGPAVVGVSTLRNEAIAWFLVSIALIAIAVMLTDDDRDRGRWAAAWVIGLGLLVVGVVVALGGGPLTYIGFVAGFIGASVVAIAVAYSNWVADWSARKRAS